MKRGFRGAFRNYGNRRFDDEDGEQQEQTADEFIKIPKNLTIEEQVAYLLEKQQAKQAALAEQITAEKDQDPAIVEESKEEEKVE